MRPLEDYGLIGNMLSAALVGNDGSIDWLCLPRFDSPACFAALLGSAENGRWKIAPKGEIKAVTQRYLPDTAVLETRFETASGVVTVTDFMPLSLDEETVDVIRMVEGVEGEVAIHMDLTLRFNYGEVVPWVRRRDYGLSAVAGPDAVELHASVPLEGRDFSSYADFTVRKGDSVPFTLSYHPSHGEPHFVADRHEARERTVEWWHEWGRHCHFPKEPAHWRDAVVRSLITLKLLTYAPTGGIVAAPTTSLPEALGGPRNWDYRYCWLRDSALTLTALLTCGFRTEAEAWRQWVRRATAGHPKQLRIMYDLEGGRWLPEVEVPWLAGYENSLPVRVGNGASDQMQLDIYGEIADTLYQARRGGIGPMDKDGEFQRVVLEHLETIWQSTGHGIWEMRGPLRSFTHSKMMCWVAFDRAVRLAEEFGVPGPVDHWRSVRDAIHAEVCEKGFNKARNTFTQYYGGETVDASLLLMAQVGFLEPSDPRLAGTIAAVEEELRQDGFVLRYRADLTDDGLAGTEGAFLACSFWLADAYALTGRRQEAVDLFEELLALRNGLGLLAEEYDHVSKRLIGNFPQGFSHIGLINTANNLVGQSHANREGGGG